jgi:hypothetical protein
MNFGKTSTLLFSLMFITGIQLVAQVWVVPEDQKMKVSPFRFNADSIKKGETVYFKNCQSCHGNPGKNNWAKITPEPGDPASDKYQAQTDGEMFYRITNGKTPMPEFRNVLSENERWNVISFIRSFNPKYIQPNPELKAGSAGKQVTLALHYKKEIEKIQVVAMEIATGKKMSPASGVEIVLFVKRYFGSMQLGEPKTTNAKGEVLFDIPSNLPGDRNGYVDLTAMVHDPSGKIGEAQVKATVSAGKPTTAPSLIATRAWWTVRGDAPVWVILAYTLSVIIVWGFIIRIVYSVSRIRKM